MGEESASRGAWAHEPDEWLAPFLHAETAHSTAVGTRNAPERMPSLRPAAPQQSLFVTDSGAPGGRAVLDFPQGTERGLSSHPRGEGELVHVCPECTGGCGRRSHTIRVRQRCSRRAMNGRTGGSGPPA